MQEIADEFVSARLAVSRDKTRSRDPARRPLGVSATTEAVTVRRKP
jgi:hypothetical protein